ncbi:hypothetical protein RFEPED_0018 [Rickettsia felis str. Pedreira]|uniref:Uncharacterized protein n=1 Tax=Rickettsia felis str. Pedreira TaxID=1359196 RepID=A0A0F3MQF3_RICFI|nr:hypothetical protein RFEPED_0018 [Rickettsia felis str. Pedreira]
MKILTKQSRAKGLRLPCRCYASPRNDDKKYLPQLNNNKN